MNAQQFVTELAAITGIGETELRTVDRVLTVAGLRAKARGRSIPDVTRIEGVRLLLAACASKAFTEADNAFKDIQKFYLYGTRINFKRVHDLVGDPLHEQVFGFSQDEAKGLKLPEAVALVCGHLAKPENEKLNIRLEIAVSGPVSILCEHDDGDVELHFTGAVDFNPGGGAVQTLRRVSPKVLRWIGQNTEEAD